MNTKEIKEKVETFIKIEESSCTPMQFTPENVARLCYITVEDAAQALKELGKKV